jgi:hypothetical protein
MTVRKDEFARRRRQLMRMMGKGAIAILPAATEKQRNSDVHYHYRPDSDFHYLTGFDELRVRGFLGFGSLAPGDAHVRDLREVGEHFADRGWKFSVRGRARSAESVQEPLAPRAECLYARRQIRLVVRQQRLEFHLRA